MAEPRNVVLAGGGSAGHVAPLLATAEALRRRFPEVGIRVLGTAEGLETRLVPERGFELVTIPKVAFPRRPDGAAVRFPGAFRRAVARAGQVLEETRPEVVIGFGGYVCPPVYLAARRRRVPVVVHEANAKPGLANVLGARFAAVVATTFSATRLPRAVRIGMPLRREITRLDRAALREEALAGYGFSGRRPVILVTGGSLGAQRLNEAFAGARAGLAEAGVDVLHLTGRGKAFEAPAQPGSVYTVLEYCDRMDLAFSAADLVVCRAGAGTVCELTALALPAVLVPLPVGNGEQRLNAADLVAAGGAELVADAEVSARWVLEQVVPLVKDQDRLTAMSRASQAVGQRDADERLVDLVVRVLEGRDG